MKFSPTQIKRGKVVATILWLLAVVAFFMPELVPLSSVFLGIGVFLVISHLAEIIIFNKLLKTFSHYIGVFFYGLLYINQLAIQYRQSQGK